MNDIKNLENVNIFLSIFQNFDPLISESRDFSFAVCNGDVWILATAQRLLKLLEKNVDYERSQIQEVIDHYEDCAKESEDDFTVINYPYSNEKTQQQSMKFTLDNFIHHLNE